MNRSLSPLRSWLKEERRLLPRGARPWRLAASALGLVGLLFALEILRREARISADLEAACAAAGQPLLRLERPGLTGPEPRRGVVQLEAVEQLARQPLAGERLLLAIGSRGLAEALRHSQAAAHYARILDNPRSLQLAW